MRSIIRVAYAQSATRKSTVKKVPPVFLLLLCGTVKVKGIIESVDSISRDEPDSPLTQYITNAGISRARYTITHFKQPSCSTADFKSSKCITSL